ncbi:MAG: T9SS type A sorting domain-containing protein [Bacteroidota bacterium]
MKTCILFLGLAFFFAFPCASGQYSYHIESKSGGNPGGLNTETDFDLTGWTTLLTGGQTTNMWSSTFTLPFPFSFYGQNVSAFKASANGVITFDVSNSAIPGNNVNLPTNTIPDLSIACFWEEFANAPPIGTNDLIQYKVFGTAPNRQFWIRWYSYEWGPTSFVYVATVLEESSNHIYLVDMFSSPSSNWITSTIGVQEDHTFGVQYGNSNTSLSQLGSGYADNHYYELTPFLIPPQDLVPVELVNPAANACGMGLESVTVRISNIGQQTATNLQAAYSINGSPISGMESVPGSVAPGDTLSYTFVTKADLSMAGAYDIQVWVNGNGDTNSTNDTMQHTLTNIQEISVFPYKEDFEAGNGGWESGGTYSSWEWGVPAATTISGAASGQRAWSTNRLGTYNSFESSWIISPCFNLSNVSIDTWVGMKIWWETESSWDGLVLQSSIDDGDSWQVVGEYGAPDWYNWQYINSFPGGQPVGWSGWNANNDGSGGWVAVTHQLDPGLIGQSSVRFRLAFSAGGTQNSDGIGFDDFVIGSPPTVVFGDDGWYCEGDSILGGTDPQVDYLWSTGAQTSSVRLHNLTGQTIIDSILTIVATNDIGLFRRDTIHFSMKLPLEIHSAIATAARCGGEASGAIDVSVAGGQAPFAFMWSDGQTMEDPTQLMAGEYDVLISDAVGCKIQSESIFIEEPDSLILEGIAAQISCFGRADGQISLAVSGGTSPLSIQWDHGPVTEFLDSLLEGRYQVRLSDGMGCEDSLTFEIQEPDSLSSVLVSIQDASCQETADGWIDLLVEGGTVPYNFAWSNGDTTEQLMEVKSGIYSVQISDANGCSLPEQSFTIEHDDNGPTAQFDYHIQGGTVFFQDASSGGVSYQWTFGDQTDGSTETDPVHVFSNNGTYVVSLIVSNPCGSDTLTQEISLVSVGNERMLIHGTLTLSPNPARSFIGLNFQQMELKDASAALYSLNGKEILYQELGDIHGQSQISLSLPLTMPAGIYLLKVHAQEGSLYRRVVVTE